jgi:cysteine desulfurase/selenocysteine lyase
MPTVLHRLEDLAAKLRGVKLVALSHVSNTLGHDRAAGRHRPAARMPRVRVVLVDGAQSAPHFAVDVRALDVDFFTWRAATRCAGRPVSASCTVNACAARRDAAVL